VLRQPLLPLLRELLLVVPVLLLGHLVLLDPRVLPLALQPVELPKILGLLSRERRTGAHLCRVTLRLELHRQLVADGRLVPALAGAAGLRRQLHLRKERTGKNHLAGTEWWAA
jgi:hypothetical protein